MPAVEPHPRRRRAPRRALVIAACVTVSVLGPLSPAGAQLPPLEEPTTTTTTTEADPVETTTTTEADPAPTTTEAPTTTTRATTTTTRSPVRDDSVDGVDDEDGGVVDDVVVGEDEDTVDEQVPDETTSTGRDVLVSGDGTEGAESTTTTSTTVVEVAADDGAMDEETQIWLIVAGLVVVAALIGVWTWRYWARTKPVADGEDPDPTTVFHQD